jgi:CRP/FNR family cyclic AMP-dependent transcriptional regulator
MPPPAPAAVSELAILPAMLRALAERGEVRHYRKGTLLIQEGDHGDTLFIILSGRLRVFSAGDRDREITYGVYGPAEYLGETQSGWRPALGQRRSRWKSSTCAVVTRRTLESLHRRAARRSPSSCWPR